MDPAAVMSAVAAQIEEELGGAAAPVIEHLQVTDYWNINPTPPSIDVYPSDPFQEPFLQHGNTDMRFYVRARVSTADHEAGQAVLLSLMDSTGSSSLGQAILSNRTLGGLVGGVAIETVGGFGRMIDVGAEESYMGALWTVRVLPP